MNTKPMYPMSLDWKAKQYGVSLEKVRCTWNMIRMSSAVVGQHANHELKMLWLNQSLAVQKQVQKMLPIHP